MVERAPSRLVYIALGVVVVLLSLGASYLIGTSGSGQINVNATIIEGQKDVPESERVRTNTRATVPNGGLVPTEPGANTPPPPEVEGVEDTTASTSDEAATTTDDAVGENTEPTDGSQSLEELSTSLAEEEGEPSTE